MFAHGVSKLELDDRLLEEMEQYLKPYLQLTGKMRRERPHILLEVHCTLCDKTFWVLTNLPMEDYRGLQFDRIDTQGHYEPGNLRLVSAKKNAMNKRNNVYVEYMGQNVLQAHLWDLVKTDNPDFQLTKWGLIRRLQNGMSVQEAIAKPPRARHESMTSSMPDPDIVSLYRES